MAGRGMRLAGTGAEFEVGAEGTALVGMEVGAGVGREGNCFERIGFGGTQGELAGTVLVGSELGARFGRDRTGSAGTGDEQEWKIEKEIARCSGRPESVLARSTPALLPYWRWTGPTYHDRVSRGTGCVDLERPGSSCMGLERKTTRDTDAGFARTRRTGSGSVGARAECTDPAYWISECTGRSRTGRVGIDPAACLVVGFASIALARTDPATSRFAVVGAPCTWMECESTVSACLILAHTHRWRNDRAAGSAAHVAAGRACIGLADTGF